MACRWVWEACRRRGWEYRLVTPDSYRAARSSGAVKALFTVARRGILFFDDMDLALRDRETVKETEDQSVFLSEMDGLTANEGVVFVFTTNCSLQLIDRAFKRPGRLDVVIRFRAPDPDAALRRELIGRWHADIRAGIAVEEAVRSTEGYSFADVEELKNLLVMHYAEAGDWDWSWALRQFAINRSDMSAQPDRRVGFSPRAPVLGFRNGAGDNSL
jgi:AAA+ superfamily predicted ATPase